MRQEKSIWADLTPEEHEFQYNPRKAFPDADRYRLAVDPANRDALAMPGRQADIAYGHHPLRGLDIYPASGDGGARAPVHIFLHGGYWRAQDKENFAFVAGALAPHGITVVVANYELCPASTLDGVVDSAIAAMRWTYREIGRFGGDPERITLSGHSAGAHLGAAIIAHDWAAEGLPANPLKAALLITGIYDPAPAIRTSVNADLRLDENIAARHNLEKLPPCVRCPVAITAGGLESWHWIDQSFRYSHHLRRHGLDPEVHVQPGADHFDILHQYLDRDSLIMAIVRRQAAGTVGETVS